MFDFSKVGLHNGDGLGLGGLARCYWIEGMLHNSKTFLLFYEGFRSFFVSSLPSPCWVGKGIDEMRLALLSLFCTVTTLLYQQYNSGT